MKVSKVNAFKRFMLFVAPPAFASAVSFIQLDGTVWMEKTGAGLWWALGLGFAAIAIWQLIRVVKESN